MSQVIAGSGDWAGCCVLVLKSSLRASLPLALSARFQGTRLGTVQRAALSESFACQLLAPAVINQVTQSHFPEVCVSLVPVFSVNYHI